MSETCDNCGRAIGRLETPHVYGQNVVCAGCLDALSRPQTIKVELQPAKKSAGREVAEAGCGLAMLGILVPIILILFLLLRALAGM